MKVVVGQHREVGWRGRGGRGYLGKEVVSVHCQASILFYQVRRTKIRNCLLLQGGHDVPNERNEKRRGWR